MCSYAACAGRIPGYESAGTFFGGGISHCCEGFRDCRGLYRGYFGVIVYILGCIGIMEKIMESTIMWLFRV